MQSMLALTLTLGFAFAQDAEVQTVLEKYRAARPTEQELSIWRIDWIPQFAEAREKAGREGRPLLFIWNRNISGPDSLYTGHC